MATTGCAASVTPCSMNHEKIRRQPELRVLALAERFCIDCYDSITRMPAAHRFRLCKQLEDACFQLVSLVIDAAASGQKSKVYRLDEHIRFIHSTIRVGVECKVIKASTAGNRAKQLSEIGSIVGAWKQRINSNR